MTIRLLILCLLAAAPAGAETLLDGPGFAARVSGKTIHFDRWGEAYGAEQYLPDRRVIWRFEGEACQPGRWYPQGDAICFVYDDQPGPICWSVIDAADGLRVRIVGDLPENDLTVRRETTAPLACPGEFLGS
jgi:hypothetical protein